MKMPLSERQEKKDIKLSTLDCISQNLEKPISSLIFAEEFRKDENAEFLNYIYSEMSRYMAKGGVTV